MAKAAAAADERMRAAIGEAVALGPRFLNGDVDADRMAHAMVRAVEGYERAAGGSPPARVDSAGGLQEVLGELHACGSGYLAGRCDAACVARTMTWMVEHFPPAAETAH